MFSSRALQASGVWVWLNTNPFKQDAPQYHPSKAMQLIKKWGQSDLSDENTNS
jgi:hypothetical protein